LLTKRNSVFLAFSNGTMLVQTPFLRVQVLGHEEAFRLPAQMVLCGVAYRPIVRDGREQIAIWPSPLEVGQVLPVLPLALDAEIAVPVDLESTYTIACQRRRLA